MGNGYGCCYGTRHYSLPAVTPRTTEDWARIGLRETLKVHKWLSQQLVKQEAKHKRSSSSSTSSDTNDNDGSSSTSSASTSTSPFDSDFLIRVRFTITSRSGLGSLEIYETPATLAAVREDIRNLARDIGGAHRLGEGNILHEDRFLRIAGWLVMNRTIVSTCPIPLTMKLLPGQCHTLLPELTIHKIKHLLYRSRILMNKSDIHSSYVISEFSMDRWLSKEKASIGDSVFFPFFWRVVDTSLVLPSDHSANAHLRYTPAEFVQAVDRFCTFTEEELLRFAFFCLARIGTAPGETPFIAVSSLTKEFSELQEAALDRTHPSRSFLDEIKKRMVSIKKHQDERVRIMKTAACVTYSEKYDRANIDRTDNNPSSFSSSSSSASPSYHYSQYRRSSFNSLVEGPEDLMTVAEFLEMAKRSPISVFDIIYLQLHMRRRTFGEEFWLARQQDIQKLRNRSQASIVFPTSQKLKEKDEENTFSSSSSSNSDSFGNLYYYGYDAQRANPLPDPYSLSTLPTLAKIEPLRVSLAVKFALASGTLKTPSTKDEPYLSHHHSVSRQNRKNTFTSSTGINVPIDRDYNPSPSAPSLTVDEANNLNLPDNHNNNNNKDESGDTKRKVSSTTKRSIGIEVDSTKNNDKGHPSRPSSFISQQSNPDTTTSKKGVPLGSPSKKSLAGSFEGFEGITSDDETNTENNVRMVDIIQSDGKPRSSSTNPDPTVIPSASSFIASKKQHDMMILDTVVQPFTSVDRSNTASPVVIIDSRRSSLASQADRPPHESRSKLSSRPSSAANYTDTNGSSSSSSSNSGTNTGERRLYQGRKKNRHGKSKGKIEVEDGDPLDFDDEAAAAHWKASHQ